MVSSPARFRLIKSRRFRQFLGVFRCGCCHCSRRSDALIWSEQINSVCFCVRASGRAHQAILTSDWSDLSDELSAYAVKSERFIKPQWGQRDKPPVVSATGVLWNGSIKTKTEHFFFLGFTTLGIVSCELWVLFAGTDWLINPVGKRGMIRDSCLRLKKQLTVMWILQEPKRLTQKNERVGKSSKFNGTLSNSIVMILTRAVAKIEERPADGESCVGRDVLKSRLWATADCTNTVPLICVFVSTSSLLLDSKTFQMHRADQQYGPWAAKWKNCKQTLSLNLKSPLVETG